MNDAELLPSKANQAGETQSEPGSDPALDSRPGYGAGYQDGVHQLSQRAFAAYQGDDYRRRRIQEQHRERLIRRGIDLYNDQWNEKGSLTELMGILNAIESIEEEYPHLLQSRNINLDDPKFNDRVALETLALALLLESKYEVKLAQIGVSVDNLYSLPLTKLREYFKQVTASN